MVVILLLIVLYVFVNIFINSTLLSILAIIILLAGTALMIMSAISIAMLSEEIKPGPQTGPVISEQARRWVNGEIDSKTYFDECFTKARKEAKEHVNYLLGRK